MHIDCDWPKRMHRQRMVSRCFASLCQLRKIHHSVLLATPQMLVATLVHSQMDYRNGVLVGLTYMMCQLQSILNAFARLIHHLIVCNKVTDAFISFQWLWVLQAIQYKLAVLMYKVLTMLSWSLLTICLTNAPICHLQPS